MGNSGSRAIIDVVEVTAWPVLRSFNLKIYKGEVVALMGPNGSEKSTLVGVLAGVHAPLEGSVEIEGLRRRRSVGTNGAGLDFGGKCGTVN